MVKLLLKVLKNTGLISKLLPALLRAWAEGGLGEPARKVYWWLAGYKAVTGAIFIALGTGLEAVAASYPDLTWAPAVARGVFWAGTLLASIGLVDGGVRSPWPEGTPIPSKAKKG